MEYVFCFFIMINIIINTQSCQHKQQSVKAKKLQSTNMYIFIQIWVSK